MAGSRYDGRRSGRGPGPRWGFAIVRGASMRPTLDPGDRLLVRYGVAPEPGRIVVARFADGTTAVKRAAERREGGWWLLSDNADEGVDSRHRGVVPDDDVTAVVLLRAWPRPRLFRGV
ncbi:S24 family peptidase [Nocardioides sp. MH1]|uniref:S24 family peptidase n=1 Tax=Nocardioides sp. MH1 TaxID=3242490 RepID=UPI003520E9BF